MAFQYCRPFTTLGIVGELNHSLIVLPVGMLLRASKLSKYLLREKVYANITVSDAAYAVVKCNLLQQRYSLLV
jgi:hypothetical protein